VADSAEARDGFCASLETGDYDGDGYADLAIGVTGENLHGLHRAGAIHILRGSADGLTTDGQQFWHEFVTGIAGEPQTDSFGGRLAAGDFNGDGRDDLAVGVPDRLLQGPGVGAVFTLYGGAHGLTVAGNQLLYQGGPLPGPVEGGDFYDLQLAVEDFNGDGRDELVIGAPLDGEPDPEWDRTISEAGTVTVVPGSPIGLDASSARLWGQGQLRGGHSGYGEFFGSALATADYNGDGSPDLAVDVPGNFSDEDGTPWGGAVYVLHGATAGLMAPRNQYWVRGWNGMLGHSSPYEGFGYTLLGGR
jgi:hypothetical protein